jgi:hypothetical protein
MTHDRCFIWAIISGRHNSGRHNNRAHFQSGASARKKPAKGGFGVEYALYMMDLVDLYNIGNTDKTALSPAALAASNLDARKRSPYTSAVPETDMILDPRAALIKGNGEAGMVEDFLRCRDAVN